MFTPTVQKKASMSFIIKVDPSKVSRGHQPHLSGAGKHHDRRLKRLRTRSAQRQAAFSE
jgi:hypothetical protein